MSDVPLNHYMVLGVGRDASEDEIEAGYRRVRTDGDEAFVGDGAKAARSADIEEAYAVLRDPARRAEYDESLD